MKKKNQSATKTLAKFKEIQIGLFSKAPSVEKRELIRQLEFQKDLREHLAEVVRAVRSLNKMKNGA